MDIAATREEFGERQAQMTRSWYEHVQRTQGDVAAFIRGREDKYLGRWRAAARFMPERARVFDIGGGNLFPRLISFFLEAGLDYSYLDVDPACVAGSRALAGSMGLDPTRFREGFNDALYPADGSVDAVFSSHCLEHSIDITRTFAEVNRVLVRGGVLAMGVPLGWEQNPEHPYFFAPDDWIGVVEDAGFTIVVAQVGTDYAENGYDCFIVARKTGTPVASRLDPARHTKVNYRFVGFDHASIAIRGTVTAKADHAILEGDDWQVEIAVPSGTIEVLPVLARHPWSGIVAAEWRGSRRVADLYSWVPYVQPVRIAGERGEAGRSATLVCAGTNPNSHSSQCVLYGIMVSDAG